ncbi:MAG TPA: CaiB/BaiF CoA-transferase family protein [Actinomycetota bacterium]|nr:CaiB/BaiF CoA-transferase family protein [Actinomycetota bacterium]
MRLLEHVRVVELGQVIAGTFGGMILSDLGAEVIKVEPPGGDPGRRSAIYGVGPRSAIHLFHNRNKKSVVLDLKTSGGREVLLDLVRRSDAVVENFRPGVVDRLGLGFQVLRQANPDVVLVSVSGFGTNSPYRDLPAYDLILQAMTGHMAIMGEPGRPPVIMGIPIADLLAGVFAALAVVAGVAGRREPGRARHFDIAMFDVMVEMLSHVATLYLNTGRDQEPQGSAHPFITPWQAFRCRDGRYVVVAPREEHFWARLCEALGIPELAEQPEFRTAEARQAHRHLLLPRLEAVFAGEDSGTWLQRLRAAGVPCAPVNRMAEVFADPHVEARQMVRSFRLGEEEFRTVGNALKVESELEPPVTPPPELGQHTREVLASLLGYSEDRIRELEAEGALGTPAQAPPRVGGGVT